MSQSEDREHLKLISLFHYIVGGMMGVFSLFPCLHLAIGLFLIFSPESFPAPQGPAQPNDLPPAMVGWIFVGVAAVWILIGLSMAGSVAMAGRFLSARRNYRYCYIMAVIECMFIPFGTILGVFTLIVLTRKTVKSLFEGQPSTEIPSRGYASPDEILDESNTPPEHS